MRKFIAIALLFSMTSLLNDASAREIEGKSNNPNAKKEAADAKSAECVAPNGFTIFSLNNVRFGLETAGQLWEDRPGGSNPSYEIPKGGGIHSIFAGALWMGGLSPDQQLKLGAITFRQSGTDFWPGPLTIDGTATASAELCDKFDRHFTISRADVELHRLYYQRILEDAENGTNTASESPFELGYTPPSYFYTYPAINPDPLYSFYLAPFFDWNGDGFYSPDDGDYPWYDLDGEIDCNTRLVTDPIPLFGDETIWWVFNDKGGVHSEFGGDPIGMEVQSQAFAFTSNNEINNMTFYNYTLINRGTQTLTQTYFGQWVDPDLGCHLDDFVGCDVQRGLGYCYNGDNEDEDCSGSVGYGDQPPAVGVDFFEGPFQDADGIDNPLTEDIAIAEAELGIPYPGLGIGYGDGVIDNERFGMRKFVYYDNNTNPVNGNPATAVEVYNYLTSRWRNGARMHFGGNGTATTGTTCDYMFPGTTDPLSWGTLGELSDDTWTEENVGNTPADRRWIQSAGPFVLDPGEYNNITVGAVWARAKSGGAFSSYSSKLTRADDKAQALFDNCFRILNGPNAPDVAIQELDRELILYLSNNSVLSNNYKEEYIEKDPTIPLTTSTGEDADIYYHFQGYKIYQVVDETVSASELTDPDRARLAFQCDLKDFKPDGTEIGQIINFLEDADLGYPIPTEMVNGANDGIQHSFRITEDLFASSDRILVNHRKYHFMAIAYGYNNYENYNLSLEDPLGQALPYIESRKAAVGDVRVFTAIPHKTDPESNGTVINSAYGDGVDITRLEGTGNGGNALSLSSETEDEIMSGLPWKADNLVYDRNGGPVSIKVIDPLNVKDANFKLNFVLPDTIPADEDAEIEAEFVSWYLVDLNNPDDTIRSERTITQRNEQIIPEYGISLQIEQYELAGTSSSPIPEPLPSSLVFADASKPWLTGVPDTEGLTPQNWIRSGGASETCDPISFPPPQEDPCVYNDFAGRDDGEVFETILDGTIAPWNLVAQIRFGASREDYNSFQSLSPLKDLKSVDFVLTSDKSKWSRVPVIENQIDPTLSQNNQEKMFSRLSLSVDKNGRNQTHPNVNQDEATYFGQQVLSSSDVDDLLSGLSSVEEELFLNNLGVGGSSELIGKSMGMGWFPGYAIDLESGERLNLAFSEDSWLAGENGRDMLWNPTSRISTFLGLPLFGGVHYVYVFGNNARETENLDRMPLYDGGQYSYEHVNGSSSDRRNMWRSCLWVALPLLEEGFEMLSVENGLIPTTTRVSIRVSKPYERFATMAKYYPEFHVTDQGSLDYDIVELFDETPSTPPPGLDNYVQLSENDWFPSYEFSTKGLSTVTNDGGVASDALDLINVVPNPYFAFSQYETGRLDNRVKVINIPERCIINIYNTSGTLVRTLDKDSPQTYIEWDLKNQKNIPIAGGVYIFHIEAPGIGEKTVKWFGALRPADLQNF